MSPHVSRWLSTVAAVAAFVAVAPHPAFAAPTDPVPPTPPTNLTVTDIGSTTATFTWGPATDNVGVVRYEITNGTTLLKTVGYNTLTTTVDTLTPETVYGNVTVSAFDAAGYQSRPSNSVYFKTYPEHDITPPTAPGNLRVVDVSSTTVTLAWDPSTDDSGRIAAYAVFRGGAKVVTTRSTQAVVSGLTPATSYDFVVVALDLAGNMSPPSNRVTARTSDPPAGGIPQFDRKITELAVGRGVDFLPDGSALVTEQLDLVRVTAAGEKTTLGRVPGATGLLGLAISPNFAADHAVYVYHTTSGDNRIVKMTYDGTLKPTSTPVLTGIAKGRYSNGGRLRFGPDGKLYATTGDAKAPAKAQDKKSLNGKVLRLNPDGSAPADNPFFALGGNARYVHSYGHRNPEGLAWDSRGQLWEAEFGEGSQDELNLITRGGNYGWPSCEGTKGSCAGSVAPKRTWPTRDAGLSGIEIVNDWVYLAGVTGQRLWVVQINGGPPKAVFTGVWGPLHTVVKSPDGGLWLASATAILRLRFTG